MNKEPVILHIELGNQQLTKWLKQNRYIIYSELIRYSEKLIKEKLEVIQAIMVSNVYDNIVFIIRKESLNITLERAMDYFMSIEEYEKCAKVRDLFQLIDNEK
jgi:hypothetical protein